MAQKAGADVWRGSIETPPPLVRRLLASVMAPWVCSVISAGGAPLQDDTTRMARGSTRAGVTSLSLTVS